MSRCSAQPRSDCDGLAIAAMRQVGSNCDKPLRHGSGLGSASWCCLRSSPCFTACYSEYGWKDWQMEYLLYWLFFQFIGCSIARVVIPALSFGQVYVHP